MRSRVDVTVGRPPSVRPSVRLSHLFYHGLNVKVYFYRLLQQRVTGLLLGAPQAEDIDRQRRTPSSNGAAAARC